MMDKNKGFLHCRGKDIVDGDGNRFQALGFGLGGTFYPEGYMWQVFGGPELPEKFCESPTYIFNGIQEIVGYEWAKKFWDRYLENWTTEEDIKTMAKWGANHIRLPLTYKTLTDKDGSYLESGFDDIERVVSWCRKYGLYVVLDLHAAPGGQNPWHFCDSDGTARLWEEPDQYWPWTINLWREIARRYVDDPIIFGYDLLNEVILPEGHTTKELRDLYAAITRAIREVDKNHILFIEGDNFARDFTNLEPFDDNKAYSYHMYKYDGPDPEISDIQIFLDLRDRHNVPLWNGETGDNNGKWWTNNIKLHVENNIGICMWTHKKITIEYQPYVVRLVPGFKEIAEYISGRGPKPDVEYAKRSLMEQADAMATEQCVLHGEFLEGFDWFKSLKKF